MSSLLFISALAFTVTIALAADPAPSAPPRPAAECAPRNGLPSFFSKLQRSEEVRVAYLGGSITEAPGWRPQSIKWFQTQFPNRQALSDHRRHRRPLLTLPTEPVEVYCCVGGSEEASYGA